METAIRGRVYTFGNNIDTDQIYPGRYLELTEPQDLAQHTLEGADPDFKNRFVSGGIVVGGTNFGCGSSREHAAIALQAAGVSLVIAESFGRIFFRNCINLGLPLLICPHIREGVVDGDEVEVDLESGLVENLTRQQTYQGQPLSEYVLHILEAGGIKPLLKAKIAGSL